MAHLATKDRPLYRQRKTMASRAWVACASSVSPPMSGMSGTKIGHRGVGFANRQARLSCQWALRTQRRAGGRAEDVAAGGRARQVQVQQSWKKTNNQPKSTPLKKYCDGQTAEYLPDI